MEMVSVKLPKRNKKEMAGISSEIEQDQYPYGMRIRFETEQVNSVPGVKELDTKDKVKLVAECSVISKSINKEVGGKERINVELQIEKVGVTGGKGDAVSVKEFMEDRNKKGYRRR
jgi:hypothetical protein